MSEANKAVVRRFVEELWSQGGLDVADEIIHPDANPSHGPWELPGGPEIVCILGQVEVVHPALVVVPLPHFIPFTLLADNFRGLPKEGLGYDFRGEGGLPVQVRHACVNNPDCGA